MEAKSPEEARVFVYGLWKEHREEPSWKWFSYTPDSAGNTMRGSVYIGSLFAPEQKSAVLSWPDGPGTVHIAVLHWIEEQWTAVFSAQQMPVEALSPSLQRPYIHFEDFNFDGWNDIRLMTDLREDGAHFDQLWLVNGSRFTGVPDFQSLTSPEADAKNRLIYTRSLGRCPETPMRFGAWILEETTLKNTKQVEVNCCGSGELNCAITVDGSNKLPVPSSRVFLYVPEHFHTWMQKHLNK